MFKLKDTVIALFGLTGYMIQSVVRGAILSQYGFYAAILPAGFGPVTSVGIRAHCSKIIPRHEIGKVFALVRLFINYIFILYFLN